MQAVEKYQSLLAQGKSYEFALKIKTVAARSNAKGKPAEAITACVGAAIKLSNSGNQPEAIDLLKDAVGFASPPQGPFNLRFFVGSMLKVIQKNQTSKQRTDLLKELSKVLQHADKEVLNALLREMVQAGAFHEGLSYLPKLRDPQAACRFLQAWRSKLSRPQEQQLAYLKTMLSLFSGGTELVQQVAKSQEGVQWGVGGRVSQLLRASAGISSYRCWKRVGDRYGALLRADPGVQQMYEGAGGLLFR